MQSVIDDFNERVLEVEQYLRVLERLENPSVVLYRRDTGRPLRILEEESLKVMKATMFLLVYNVTESAIRSAFSYLYECIKNEGKNFEQLNERIQTVWIKQWFDKLDEDSSSKRSYREHAEKLAKEILKKSTISLSKDLLPISGNLDSDEIRKVCHRHGLPIVTHYSARGGMELETVKSLRNALAHGNISFSACGQQYTVQDLKRIKQQSFTFVRSILRCFRRFMDDRKYAT